MRHMQRPARAISRSFHPARLGAVASAAVAAALLLGTPMALASELEAADAMPAQQSGLVEVESPSVGPIEDNAPAASANEAPAASNGQGQAAPAGKNDEAVASVPETSLRVENALPQDEVEGSKVGTEVAPSHEEASAPDSAEGHEEKAIAATQATRACAAPAAGQTLAEDDGPAVKYLNMFRLYNPNSGEHFYTSSQKELKTVCEAGWRYEGVGWVSPDSGAAVFRLYNPNAGDHHYTTSSRERDGLVRAGWRYEGIGWRSEGDDGTAVLRQYNPNARAGAHNFTVSPQEAKHLVAAGWRDEGRAWFASRQATQPIKGFWMVTSAWGSRQRYWVGSDALLARERVVTPSEGAGYYAYASSDGSILRGVRDLGDGYAMVADDDGRLLATGCEGFSKLRGADGRERLYYLHDGGEGFSLARVGHFERGGKHFWGQASDGSILRGKLRQGKGMLVANPTTGALLWSRGMVVTGEYDDGELQRYYVDDSVGAGLLGARLGLFTYDGKRYYGREDQGYVVRGTYVVSRYYAKTHGSFPGDWHDDTVAIADNDGVLISREEFGRRIVSAARSMVGGSYTNDDSAYYPLIRSFNCSGFSWWVYSTLGINLSHNQGYFSYYAQQDNRNDSQMWGVEKRAGWRYSFDDLRPGDLVFFSPLRDKYHTGHVGVYIGGGQMIDSNVPGVQVRNVAKWTYVGGGLPITLV